ncbi:Mbov_0401 family ICE element transposase-like protein [Mesomycoplasma neurolyticum]|nr:hypothetical protein [Mesomycoplasma neurolyticum]
MCTWAFEKQIKKFDKAEMLFKNSLQRKEMGLHIHSIIIRKLKTICGVWEFKKIRYRNKNKNIIYYDNPHFQIEKHKNIDSNLKKDILEKIRNRLTYENVIKSYPKNTISIFSIRQIIKKSFIDKNQKTTVFKKIENEKNIYIEMDDTYAKLQWNSKNKKYLNRLVVIHTGLDNKRNVKNKTILIETKNTDSSKISVNQWVEIIKTKIKELYKFNYKNIIVIGDGATFIKKIAQKLNAKYIIDSWHLKKILQKLVGYGLYSRKNKHFFKWFNIQNKVTIYKFCEKEIMKGNYALVLDVIYEAIQFTKTQNHNVDLSMKLQEFYNFSKYVENNKQGIQNFAKNFYIGSRTEAFVANIIKKKIKRFTKIGLNLYKFLIYSGKKNNENLFFI